MIDWSDRLSPVLVKEVRQYFHSGAAMISITLLLLGQLLLLLLIPEINEKVMDQGKIMFFILLFILLGTGFIMGGIGSLNRYTAERMNRELDFSAMTTLSPVRLILGKLLAAAVMILLLYALTLPFMIIAYFLRGIAMERMLGMALVLFPVLLILAQLGLLFGTGGKRWLSGLYYLALFLFGPHFFSFFIIGMIGGIYGGSILDSLPFAQWLLYLFILIPELSFLGFLFVLTVSGSSHVTSNRMLPIRIYLFLVFLPFGFLPGVLNCLIASTFDWSVAVTGLLGVGISAAIPAAILAGCEREYAGLRVTRSLPRNLPGRIVMFLLSSGWGGGVLFCWLIALLMVLTGALTFDGDTLWSSLRMAGIALYFVLYAEVVVLIRSKLPQVGGWVWYLAIGFLCFVVPGALSLGSLIASMTSSREPILARAFNILNPFFLAGDDDWLHSVWWVPFFFALVGLVLIFPRIREQFRRFRRGKEEEGA